MEFGKLAEKKSATDFLWPKYLFISLTYSPMPWIFMTEMDKRREINSASFRAKGKLFQLNRSMFVRFVSSWYTILVKVDHERTKRHAVQSGLISIDMAEESTPTIRNGSQQRKLKPKLWQRFFLILIVLAVSLLWLLLLLLLFRLFWKPKNHILRHMGKRKAKNNNNNTKMWIFLPSSRHRVNDVLFGFQPGSSVPFPVIHGILRLLWKVLVHYYMGNQLLLMYSIPSWTIHGDILLQFPCQVQHPLSALSIANIWHLLLLLLCCLLSLNHPPTPTGAEFRSLKNTLDCCN